MMSTKASEDGGNTARNQGPEKSYKMAQRTSLSMNPGSSILIPDDFYQDTSDDEDQERNTYGGRAGCGSERTGTGNRAYEGGFAAAAYNALRDDYMKKKAEGKGKKSLSSATTEK